MKPFSLCSFFLIVFVLSCSDQDQFTEAFQQHTAGRYLLHPDAVIGIHYNNNTLLVDWLGAKDIKPLLLDDHTFYVKEMNKKMRLVLNPADSLYYLSEVIGDAAVTYDYKKLRDSQHVPSYYLLNKDYDKALKGYLQIQVEDSASIFIEEKKFNTYGYETLRNDAFDDAIAIFKMNVALYPESANVYDSLADAYLKSGDSLDAFINYSKSLTLDSGNPSAKRYIKGYNKE
ncbi:tetratricopeptide repeat protein [Bizionia gelidisalsuginis]|uniref:Tetratricopeptide repeat protein n=1 Tax=Bizionia gelidisalsuginis TaxID=291188 RepID=A0ABY3MDA1_9FLAO|nr:tetratricopeptide repeat protein [Bizionia gelidisalsuginis]TYC16987.1 tetratricopeptide repeat protein [Bizionia gelidisalsuginis]